MMAGRAARFIFLSVGLVVTGFAVAVLVAVLHDYRQDHWLPSMRWFALASFTLLLFGSTIKEFHHRWRSQRLWFYLAGLLVLHVD
jgi:hypothetical protein